jgi:hypothetical protein
MCGALGVYCGAINWATSDSSSLISSRQIDGDHFDRARDTERGDVALCDGLAEVSRTTGPRCRSDRHGRLELGVADQLAVDVELAAAAGALALRDVGRGGGLELVTEGDVPFGDLAKPTAGGRTLESPQADDVGQAGSWDRFIRRLTRSYPRQKGLTDGRPATRTRSLPG